jgi:uncharacterized protein YyaL (SSP411 family)
MPNRLEHESSPYLRQHAENPVDWYPWGEEALARARTEDKPILLSIGYSACHWCHVMAHESFEDAETARLMNERFVCIKVDREEMPDVDMIYQQALQLQGEGGGWPLTMFLMPDGVPFFGGTYFPPRSAFGRPSFPRILVALSDAFRTRRDEVAENARQYREGLRQIAAGGRDPAATDAPLPDVIDRAATRLALRIDRRLGGFEGAPKFPNPKALELLLRAAARALAAGDRDGPELLACVQVTLTRMAQGGIYDQLGGGFHRYSTDGQWLVPHFEKMLYDNAQLLSLYADAHQLAPDPLYARVMRETAGYLERDLRDRDGGLWAAEDADSEGVEGKFYVWTPEELRRVLDDQAAERVERYLGVVAGGNWNDPHGHGPRGASILHVVERPTTPDEAAALDEARRHLLAARAARVRPGADDKVLAASNGLAIGGLSDAGRVLDAPELIDAARRTAEFVLGRMTEASRGRLLRTYKGGQAKLPGTLDDHAAVADGLIALYEASGEARWLEAAHRLVRLALGLFYEPRERAFYVTAADDPGLIERPVSTFDSAVPSGMSLMLECLVRLGDVCGERGWLEVAEAVLLAHWKRALDNPFAFSNLLNALDGWQARPTEIVLAGDDTRALERAVAAVYLPSRVIVRAAGAPPLLRALVDGKRPLDGKPAAYVCRNFTCEAPITDPAQLRAALQRR